jgi:NADH-quinone oxidoreductase subunit G
MGWTMEGLRGAHVPPALRTGPAVPGLHSVSAAYHDQAWIGGPLRGGDPGVSVLPRGQNPVALTDATVNVGAEPVSLTLIALHDPFAASETDRASPPLAARAPGPRLVLAPQDAAALGLAEGSAVLVQGALFPAPLTLDPDLPPGHVGLSDARGWPRSLWLRRMP